MKPKPPEAPPDFKADMKAFEKLPAETKELSALKDNSEKATGSERMGLDKKIRTKAKKEPRPGQSRKS